MNTSDFLLERLVEWDFRRVYGYPGDGINGIMGAFDRIGDKLEFVQVRHEEMAAFMACAHAKFTGAGCASPPPVLERSTCSTGCTTRNSITRRWSRSSGRQQRPRSVARINKKSISKSCSKT